MCYAALGTNAILKYELDVNARWCFGSLSPFRTLATIDKIASESHSARLYEQRASLGKWLQT